ncbi:MAG TPA: hypothetical protein VFE61_12295 [Candidatus Sulfotelmatobacter sp.]|nr:hypothetical protein [Candidatus Sulfotelmatobacter sp.]
MKILRGVDMHQHIPFTKGPGGYFDIIVVLTKTQQFFIREVLST